MTHDQGSEETMNATKAKEIYDAACRGNPESIRAFLRSGDGEDVNHAILDYVDDLEGDARHFQVESSDAQTAIESLQAENERLLGALDAVENICLGADSAIASMRREPREGRDVEANVLAIQVKNTRLVIAEALATPRPPTEGETT